MGKIVFGKLKKFETLMNSKNFTQEAWDDIDVGNNDNDACKKYMTHLINYLASHDGQWVKMRGDLPRLWIDFEDTNTILINEKWFDEIVREL